VARQALTGEEQRTQGAQDLEAPARRRGLAVPAGPEDWGLFGPESISWRVHSSPVRLVGGLRALIIQSLNPLVMAGIHQHSDHLEQPLSRLFGSVMTANLVVLFGAIGLVSWLTMARVVRGQVLSLRSQPFIEACRAMGVREMRIFIKHILPNLVGPIMVYATLTVPSAILQESFLSFLGVGINAPLPTWGSLAADGVAKLSPVKIHWWMLTFPCTLLAITLLSLNFMGDGLRDVFDPRKEAAKI